MGLVRLAASQELAVQNVSWHKLRLAPSCNGARGHSKTHLHEHVSCYAVFDAQGLKGRVLLTSICPHCSQTPCKKQSCIVHISRFPSCTTSTPCRVVTAATRAASCTVRQSLSFDGCHGPQRVVVHKYRPKGISISPYELRQYLK